MTKQLNVNDLKSAIAIIQVYIDQVEARIDRDQMRLAPEGWMDVEEFIKSAQFVSRSYMHSMISKYKNQFPERISKVGCKFIFDGDWMLGLILKKGNALMINKFKIFYPHIESLKMMFSSLVAKCPGDFKEI